MKITDKTKNIITQTWRWAIFIGTGLTMTMKIAEASAYESLQLIIANPEIAEYSAIANGWLFF